MIFLYSFLKSIIFFIAPTVEEYVAEKGRCNKISNTLSYVVQHIQKIASRSDNVIEKLVNFRMQAMKNNNCANFTVVNYLIRCALFWKPYYFTSTEGMKKFV